jgi:hypothetical protein
MRLDILRVFQDAGAGTHSVLRVPWLIDGEYPPLLHVLTGLMLAPFDHVLGGAVLSGLLWVVLTAVAVGLIAGRLSGRLGRFDPVAASAGATSLLLLASFQGQAIRYYYDLPMTAFLWLAVAAVLLGWDTRPRSAAVGGGLLFALAGLSKWTAVPFGGLMGLGLLGLALVSAPSRRRSRLKVAAGSGVVAVLVAGAYVVLGILWTSSSSFLSQISTAAWAEEPVEMATLPRLLFYPEGIVHAVLSPALTVLLCAFLATWVIRSRRGGVLITLVVIGQLGWLTLFLPTQDERFALTAVPALLLPGAIGFAHLARRARWFLGPLTVLVAVTVAWDFHLGLRDDPGQRHRGFKVQRVADLGLDSTTFPDAAWARGDEPGRSCAAYREQILDLIGRCKAHTVGIGEEGSPIVSEGRWWSYVVIHDAATRGYGRREGLRIHGLGELEDVPDSALDLVLTSFGPDGAVQLPGGVDRAQFRRMEQGAAVDCPETGGFVAWRPAGLPDCPLTATPAPR